VEEGPYGNRSRNLTIATCWSGGRGETGRGEWNTPPTNTPTNWGIREGEGRGQRDSAVPFTLCCTSVKVHQAYDTVLVRPSLVSPAALHDSAVYLYLLDYLGLGCDGSRSSRPHACLRLSNEMVYIHRPGMSADRCRSGEPLSAPPTHPGRQLLALRGNGTTAPQGRVYSDMIHPTDGGVQSQSPFLLERIF